MKRAQIVEPQKPLVINETNIPEAPPKGVVIKTSYAGICHSDVNQWYNEINHGDSIVKFTDNPKYVFPIVPGHEICGVVHSLGSEAESLEIGDKVSVYPWFACEECGFCTNGNPPLCTKRHFCLGVGTPGGYSTYVVVKNARNAIKVPSSIPMEVACMLPCSGLTTYNAVTTALPQIERMNKYKGKTSLLVVGAGGLGLWCLQFAKRLFPSTTRIVAADIKESNLEAAKAGGCDDVVLWDRSKSVEELTEITKKKAIDGSFDGAIDLVNSTASASTIFKSTHRGSIIVMVGLYGGQMNLSLPKMVHGIRTLQGVLTGTLEQFEELLRLAATSKLTPPPLQFITLDEAYKGMCLVRDGQVKGRCLIKFDN